MSLKPDGLATGLVDGAWWPGSRDLAVELPALLALLAGRLGWVERVTYNMLVRNLVLPRLVVDGRVVRLGGVRSRHADTLTVIGRGGQRRLTLLVVPPDTDPATAEGVLARTSRPGGVEHLETLFALRSNRTDTPDSAAYAIQRWEGEGGSGPRARPGSESRQPETAGR